VFVNAKPAHIKKVAAYCGLDMVQLHGNESAMVCSRCRPLRVIKAFRLRSRDDLLRARGYRVDGYLFDAYVRGRPGGTGKPLGLGVLAAARRMRLDGEIFLSGGLNARNAAFAIRQLRPQWVDASSSLEAHPGKKTSKIAAFIKAAKSA